MDAKDQKTKKLVRGRRRKKGPDSELFILLSICMSRDTFVNKDACKKLKYDLGLDWLG